MSRAPHDVREPLDWPQTLALGFALAFPTLGTWVYFILLSGRPGMQTAYAATKVVQFSFPLVWVVAYQRRRVRLERPSAAGVGWGLLLGVVVVAGMQALYYGLFKHSPLFAAVPGQVAEKISGFHADTPFRFFLLASFISLAHSLAEEYYWRWFTFGQLARSVPLWCAVAISSLGFTAHHVLVVGEFLKGYGAWTWFLSSCVAAGGALWAWLYQRTGTLYGPWASHLLVDAGLMWLGYDLWRAAG